jgi:hypothetical protein
VFPYETYNIERSTTTTARDHWNAHLSLGKSHMASTEIALRMSHQPIPHKRGCPLDVSKPEFRWSEGPHDWPSGTSGQNLLQIGPTLGVVQTPDEISPSRHHSGILSTLDARLHSSTTRSATSRLTYWPMPMVVSEMPEV